MGSKNVIAGDVIGHQESMHVAGNATIIKNEDQPHQVKTCHICGSNVLITDGFVCKDCGEFTCTAVTTMTLTSVLPVRRSAEIMRSLSIMKR